MCVTISSPLKFAPCIAVEKSHVHVDLNPRMTHKSQPSVPAPRIYVCNDVCAGFAPGKEDASTFETLSGSAEAKALPAVARWLGHMTSFSCGERAAWL